MKIRKALLCTGWGFLAAVTLINPSVANAKRKPAVLRVDATEASVKVYQVKQGNIYSNYQLTKIKNKSNSYKGDTFYSNETVTVRKSNGKSAVYRVLANRYGKDFGYIWHGNVKKIKTMSWNFGDYDAPTKESDNLGKFFTPSEQDQVKQLRDKAAAIGNSTKDMYARKVSTSGTFDAGQLSNSYIQATVDWINFYRQLYVLSSVTANSQWNTEAQFGAAALDAADQGLSHGLVGLAKPDNISSSDWDRGADATASSNLADGVTGPYDVISLYMNDSGNDVPGHREWLLGGINQVGVGQAGEYNDLKVFDDNDQNTTPGNQIVYPNSGLFPFDESLDTKWSVELPQSIDENSQPSISVYDNTAKTNVSVDDVTVSNTGYGNWGTSISYMPGDGDVKVNHSYSVKISNLPDSIPDISYTTKLFSLNVD